MSGRQEIDVRPIDVPELPEVGAFLVPWLCPERSPCQLLSGSRLAFSAVAFLSSRVCAGQMLPCEHFG